MPFHCPHIAQGQGWILETATFWDIKDMPLILWCLKRSSLWGCGSLLPSDSVVSYCDTSGGIRRGGGVQPGEGGQGASLGGAGGNGVFGYLGEFPLGKKAKFCSVCPTSDWAQLSWERDRDHCAPCSQISICPSTAAQRRRLPTAHRPRPAPGLSLLALRFCTH